jgi:hypothetical protein
MGNEIFFSQLAQLNPSIAAPVITGEERGEK